MSKFPIHPPREAKRLAAEHPNEPVPSGAARSGLTAFEEQSMLEGVIEATEAATWEWDVPSDEVRINERWAQLIGRTADELGPINEQAFRRLIHPDDLPVVDEALRAHFEGEVRNFDCEIRMRHRNGDWIWIQTRGRVLTWAPNSDPERMCGVHLPIGERKAQQERLRRSQELLSLTGQMAGVGGYEVNLITNVITWTDQTKRIHGVPLDYVPKMDVAINFYAPEARPVISEAVEQAIATGVGWDLELPLDRADGRRIWVRAQGSVEMRGGTPVRLFGAFQDITERRRLTEQLAEKNELLHVTLESIGDAVITTDRAGLIAWMNPVAERLTGVEASRAMGQPVGAVYRVVDETTRACSEPVLTCLEQRTTINLERDALLLAADGQEYAVEDTASPIINSAGDLLGAVVVFYDVTERRRLNTEMSYRARHDSLTGLLNRSEFEARLEEARQEALADGTEHALLYLDLDQFKIVNDTCGHSAGDELLISVVDLFKKGVRASDTVARLGGDEFAIILRRCPSEQAERVANNICATVRDFRFVHGHQGFRVSTSIGLVSIHAGWEGTSAIMQAADTSCYAAKDGGRDRVHCYQDSDAAIQSQRSRTRWALRIEEALEQDTFTLHGQKINALHPASRALPRMRTELLVRMQEADGSLIMPGAFIPAAERFRLMSRIDHWVLTRGLDVAARAEDVDFFINLSGQSLGDRDFHRSSLQRLSEVDASVRRRLVLEVTETAVVANLADAQSFIHALRELQVRVALDDFGAGMASYNYLRSLTFDYLKIDGQLVASMLENPLSMAVVRSFVDIAQVLDLEVVAEHVQSDELIEELRHMGVDYAQGFHLHRPQPIEELLAIDPADDGDVISLAGEDPLQVVESPRRAVQPHP